MGKLFPLIVSPLYNSRQHFIQLCLLKDCLIDCDTLGHELENISYSFPHPIVVPYLKNAGDEAPSIFTILEPIRKELVENEEKARVLTKPTDIVISVNSYSMFFTCVW